MGDSTVVTPGAGVLVLAATPIGRVDDASPRLAAEPALAKVIGSLAQLPGERARAGEDAPAALSDELASRRRRRTTA